VLGEPAAVTRDADVREAYAADASGLRLVPEGVARPRSVDEVVDVVRRAAAEGTAVTPAGAQSSTTGASISDRGVVLSLRAMDRILDIDAAAGVARVQAGVLVADLRHAAAEHGLLFAPDPTSERESTVGGAVACNASGARSLRYGATRPHVRALTVVLANGEIAELRRPQLEKNTVGYPLAHDPVDWFVGSEGTLGVVVEAEVALLPLPARVVGLAVPFAGEQDALAFVVAARDASRLGRVSARCLEFFDRQALGIARTAEGGAAWAPGAGAMVYAEQADGEATTADDAMFEAWLALAERHGALADEVRVYDGEAALEEARRVRHAVPAWMNERGAACRPRGGRKVSTDWAVPYPRLADALARARQLADEAGVEQAVTYGHAGNGHPHQNFVANDAAELRRVELVVEATLRHVLALGGTVAAEHGIGKLKRRWLPLQTSRLQLGLMRAVKRELDPLGILAPGNILDPA